jgi:type IV secretory pathway ATPase VirB11/archaellum biosynthesis ATPase
LELHNSELGNMKEIYLVNSEIHVIRCIDERCEKCSQRDDMGCQDLHHIKESGSEKSQIIMIEAERGLLHLCKVGELKDSQPSWRTEGWETVFIGFNSQLFEELNHIISFYRVGPYLSIFRQGKNNQTEYTAYPLIRTSLENSLIENLSNESFQVGRKVESLRIGFTKRLTQVTKDVAKNIMDLIPEINETTRMKLSEIIAHRRSILGSLMPLILDDLVEEIYLDRPGAPIYFDHQRYGRCITILTFQDSDTPRIVTLMRAESNLHLDRSNPSLKMDLRVQDALLRFSVSIPPLSSDGLHLEIRRAKNVPFSILDLMENGTMTPEAAAILVFAVSCRFNITVTGGPGTGKTTLLNALDMATPKWWRKIYIEDAIESRQQGNHHQVRFRVDPVDEQKTKFSKSDEIIKSLHRSPDYLILGEIQTAEHSKALFQAITAGLHTIQTCHSKSASSLVSRWKLGHEIQDDSLALMDIIVTLNRSKPGESKRIVSEISEIRRNSVNGLLKFSGLNKIYDNIQGLYDNWADDGAFMAHAKNLGIISHIPALRNLIDTFNQSLCPSDLEKLGEKLWSNGHPMNFIA